MKKILSVLLIAAGMLCMSGCGADTSASAKHRFSATRMDLFDTVITLTGYAESRDEFDAAAQAAFAELEDLYRLYDAYHAYDDITNICAVNAAAGAAAVSVDGRIIELLSLAREIYDASGGCVDVTAGSVLRLWHDARAAGLEDPDSARLPDAQSLTNAKAHSGFALLEVDAEANTVRLSDPEALLDVGAVAKGCAVERVRRMLPEGYLLNAGGNVCATGSKPDGEGWTVGIQDPDGRNTEALCTLSLTEGSVVTSGDYQRFYVVDGKRYHHIIDLETLQPAALWHSVTVVCADSGIADGLSTALFVLPRSEGEKLLAAFGAEAVWVDTDGQLQCTEGLRSRLTVLR